MKCAPLLGLGALAAGAGACDIDFVTRGEPVRNAELNGSLMIDARDTVRVEVQMRLDFGVRRHVLHDTVLVLDTTITPDGENGLGDLLYHATWTEPGLADEPVVVEVASPPLGATTARRPRPVGHTVVAAGPDTVVVERGRSVALPLRRPPEADGLQYEHERWSVAAAAGDLRFGLTAERAVPDTVVMPTDWLPDEFEGDLTAEVSVRQAARRSGRPDIGLGVRDVRLEIRTLTTVAWTVRVRSPSAADRPQGSR